MVFIAVKYYLYWWFGGYLMRLCSIHLILYRIVVAVFNGTVKVSPDWCFQMFWKVWEGTGEHVVLPRTQSDQNLQKQMRIIEMTLLDWVKNKETLTANVISWWRLDLTKICHFSVRWHFPAFNFQQFLISLKFDKLFVFLSLLGVSSV